MYDDAADTYREQVRILRFKLYRILGIRVLKVSKKQSGPDTSVPASD